MIEEPVLDKALAGDEDAFAQLLRPFRDLILNLAFRLTVTERMPKRSARKLSFGSSDIYGLIKEEKILKHGLAGS